jgi:putative FmdB family regulatory protein
MRRLYDFLCKGCGETFEDLIDPVDGEKPVCGYCGSTDATRLISAARIDPRLGLDPDAFPTMGDKWARIRRQRAKIENSRDP